MCQYEDNDNNDDDNMIPMMTMALFLCYHRVNTEDNDTNDNDTDDNLRCVSTTRGVCQYDDNDDENKIMITLIMIMIT